MANLIECPACKQQVSSNAGTCPHCGEPIRKNKCRSVKGGFISIAAGLILCILMCAISQSSDGVSVPPGVYLGFIFLIAGIVGACICFTSPTK